MTSTSLHPTPSSRSVATEQFRAVGLALRNEGIFFVAALLVLSVVLIGGAVQFTHNPHPPGAHMGFRYGSSGAIPMFLIGLLAPFGVWRSEDPARRSYHWSMPVARGPHTMMKLLSGWVWLMIATVVYLLFVIGVSHLVSMITAQGEWQHPAAGWEWIIAFTAPTIGYLLTSVPVVGSNYPWRWIGGVVICYGVLVAMLKAFGMDDGARAVSTITDGRYGFNAALFGTINAGAGGLTRGVAREVIMAMRLDVWVIAMPVWLVGSAVAAAVASYRYRE